MASKDSVAELDQPSRTFVDRRGVIRAFEILPGAITWLTLAAPIILSFISPLAVAYFIIAFDLYWMVKSFRISFNLYRAYMRLRQAQKIDWNERLDWIEAPSKRLASAQAALQNEKGDGRTKRRLEREIGILQRLKTHETLILKPTQLYNAVILATYNESIDILEPSIISLTEVDYPLDRLMVVMAYEERGGEQTKRNAELVVEKYAHKFAYMVAICHPDGIVGEHRGKGANISYAGRIFASEMEKRGINHEHIIVTSLDADHRPAKNYFSLLTYEYAVDPNRLHRSYQPIPMFYNNIWDAPAPMRLIATGNSFWTLTETMRPHRLRNFAAHAQGLATLIGTDFWSITTIVEDGHQFWRTYFAFDGDHLVVPVYTSVFQDAVLADSYLKTFKVQYLQLRRWAWGCSDIPFVLREMIKRPEISLGNRMAQFGRLFEAHFSQATAPLILTFVAYLPIFLNPRSSTNIVAQQLPFITSGILQIASVGVIFMIFFSLISLPPRPTRYRRSRIFGMIFQWLLLPFTSMFFSAFAAIDSQTRLMFGKYLEFYVTEKAVKK